MQAYFIFYVLYYTVAVRAIGFALEQPLHVVALACSASGILKQLEYSCNYSVDKISINHRDHRYKFFAYEIDEKFYFQLFRIFSYLKFSSVFFVSSAVNLKATYYFMISL
ncbi:MAG: hypothetical protein LBJ00_12505 [Planctomycetaceae bacterium]|nr:hypothetical protein [Planctomycetaceae bacterium]